MKELRLKIGSAYHTDLGGLVQIVGTHSYVYGAIQWSIYTGDNGVIYTQSGAVIANTNPFTSAPQDLSFEYGSRPLIQEEDVLDKKIRELKALGLKLGLGISVSIS